PADFLAHHFALSGPVYSISTACTSGARAIITAHRLLASGLCDAVICGGVDSLAHLTINGFDALQALSAGIANPFSINREGINIGEAAALFVMTRQASDGLPLLGYGNSADAWHMSSPDPKATGAVLAIRQALAQAGCDAEDIGWVNLHGTATELNDSMERLAMATCFAAGVPCTSTKPLTGHTLGAAGALAAALLWGVIHPEHNPAGQLPAQLCDGLARATSGAAAAPCTSTKPLTGHTLAAAGALAAALRRGVIQPEHNPAGQLPAQLWDGQADPALPAITLTDSQVQWQKQPRIGMSLSFAFGGNNAVLILGEA